MKLLPKLLIAGGVALLVNGLDNRLEITRYALEFDNLPKEFDDFTIAHISDYHCDSITGLETEIRNEKPDIIVCTGDMADDKGGYMPAVHLFERLGKIAPVYAVSGNHEIWRSDYSEFLRESKAVGVTYLHDERVMLEKNGAKISLAGIDDPACTERGKLVDTIKRSLERLGRYRGFEMLMFHRANMLGQFHAYGFDLIMAGHMHGGQVRLPFTKKGVCSPKSSIKGGERAFFPLYSGGFYTLGKTQMIVNRGLGNTMIVPRLFNRPEITMITLKSVPLKYVEPDVKATVKYDTDATTKSEYNVENLFFQNYNTMSTESLIDICSSPDYSDTVKKLVSDILKGRGVYLG